MNRDSERGLMRRVAGQHDLRMDGMMDLIIRARNASVLDIGCNRGLVAYEFMKNGATLCHGCDNFAEGIQVAREIFESNAEQVQVARHVFADLRNCESRFEVVDLTEGAKALKPFGNQRYDIVLMLATYHKLKRVMPNSRLSELMSHLGTRTEKWFAWRGTSEKASENEGEIYQLDKDMKAVGLKRIHTSYISQTLGACAIWERQ